MFACLAHMKVPFTAEQLLFTELRYRAVSKLLSFKGQPSFNSIEIYGRNLVTIWTFFVHIFLFFDLRCSKLVEMVESNEF